MRLRCRHSTVNFIDPLKQTRQSSPVGARCGMSFFLLELCFMSSPVFQVLYRWPTARLQQLQCVSNGATAVPPLSSSREFISLICGPYSDVTWASWYETTDCLLEGLFRLTPKKISKLCSTKGGYGRNRFHMQTNSFFQLDSLTCGDVLVQGPLIVQSDKCRYL